MRCLILASFTLLALAPLSTFAVTPPCSCIQELWVDYPGPYDLYIVLTKHVDCNETGEEELWYGVPSNSAIPQICENGNCESPQEDDRVARTFPGHGQELVGIKAWDVFRVGLESATRKMPGLEFGTPLYHRISRKNLPEKLAGASDMIVMAIPMTVHAKGSRIDGNTYYLCVQIDSAAGLPLTRAAFENATPGSGSQFQIKYHVNNEVRTGLVWLK